MILSKKRQLLCTFSTVNFYKSSIEEIKKYYKIPNNKFFVFSNEKNPTEIFITYNVFFDENTIKFKNTISIHRKKQTNTLYTLNAMNQLIKEENNGVIDQSFLIDWSLYSNSLITNGEISVKVVSLNLVDIL